MIARACTMALLPALALTAAVALGAAQTPEALLRESDVGAFVPASFRATLSLARGADDESRIEIWRSGTERTLVRFLDAAERGKYLLRYGDDLWLLTPTARAPVRLSPSHRLYGAATLDVLFTLRLAEEYRIESVEDLSTADGPVSVFELRARTETAPFAAVRYVVDVRTRRPVSARYRLASGREATLVTFEEWSPDRRHARVVAVTDLLRKSAPTRISVREFDERRIDDGLFDLHDASARQALERTPAGD